MAVRKYRPRWQKKLEEQLTPVIALIFIMCCAIAITYVLLAPIQYPNLHPRLAHFYHELIHHHPRVQVMLQGFLFFLPVAPIFAVILVEYRLLKNKLVATRRRQSAKPPNRTSRLTVGTDSATTWSNLLIALPGLTVQLLGTTRAASWHLEGRDDANRQMHARLVYVHEVYGSKSGQTYPRIIDCVVTVAGKAGGSDVSLQYTPMSPMDDVTVGNLADCTNTELGQILSNQNRLDSIIGLDAQVLSQAEGKSSAATIMSQDKAKSDMNDSLGPSQLDYTFYLPA